jgi:hypothetical protein
MREQERQQLGPHRIGKVGRRVDRVHARHHHRDLAVDGQKLGVSVRRADERGVQHARQFHVVDETAPAGDERRIFKPCHARAEKFCAHRF